MQITLIVLIVVAIFGFLLYNKYIKNRKDNKAEKNLEADNKTPEDSMPDFEKAFFEQTKAGEPYQLFLTLASHQDCAIIRSLLNAENIPTYTEGEHMNNIYGGLTGTGTSVIGIKLYILCKDYDTAYDIVTNYKTDPSGITVHGKIAKADALF